MRRPEISWNRETDRFFVDGCPVDLEEAKARWMAVDSDWTAAAYARMVELTWKERAS